MNTSDELALFANLRSQIRETLDAEWKEQGATLDELETSRRLSDLFACELASGRTPDEIETAWADKTAEEILQEYALPMPTETAGV